MWRGRILIVAGSGLFMVAGAALGGFSGRSGEEAQRPHRLGETRGPATERPLPSDRLAEHWEAREGRLRGRLGQGGEHLPLGERLRALAAERGVDLPARRGLGHLGERSAQVTPRDVTPPGSYSLSIDGDFNLGGFIFKDGAVLLHDDGAFNIALGLAAMVSTTTGAGNVALGSYALYYNEAGAANTGVGFQALLHNQGTFNTALGGYAMAFAAGGYWNTATGVAAMAFNDTGFGNVGIGGLALASNTTGSLNTAVGFYAGAYGSEGEANTAVGAGALVYSAGPYLFGNTAVGYLSLANNEEPFNTAVGYLAMTSNTTGIRNAALGAGALTSNTEGYDNTAVGYLALSSNTTGSRNTALGKSALEGLTVGSYNIGIGINAGVHATTGWDNIYLAHYGVLGGGENATIRIGGIFQNRAFLRGVRGVTTGVGDAITVLIDSQGQLGTVSSSRTAKEEVEEIAELGEALLGLRPVQFRYRAHAGLDGAPGPLHFGLIAEEVAEVFPELVVLGPDGRPETVRYHLLAPLLLAQLQEQHRLNTAQAEEIRALQEAVRRLERPTGD
jgi:hypothetical protein